MTNEYPIGYIELTCKPAHSSAWLEFWNWIKQSDKLFSNPDAQIQHSVSKGLTEAVECEMLQDFHCSNYLNFQSSTLKISIDSLPTATVWPPRISAAASLSTAAYLSIDASLKQVKQVCSLVATISTALAALVNLGTSCMDLQDSGKLCTLEKFGCDGKQSIFTILNFLPDGCSPHPTLVPLIVTQVLPTMMKAEQQNQSENDPTNIYSLSSLATASSIIFSMFGIRIIFSENRSGQVIPETLTHSGDSPILVLEPSDKTRPHKDGPKNSYGRLVLKKT